MIPTACVEIAPVSSVWPKSICVAVGAVSFAPELVPKKATTVEVPAVVNDGTEGAVPRPLAARFSPSGLWVSMFE
jgi:hypothetical protein